MIATLVIASVLMMMAGLLVHEGLLGYPPAHISAHVLSRREQAILRAAAEALFPSGGSLPSGEQAGVVLYVDRMLAKLPKRQRILIRALLYFVEHGSLFFGPVRRRVTRQSFEDRIETFRGWEVSNLYLRRMSFLSLRTLLTLAYFSHPGVMSTLAPSEA